MTLGFLGVRAAEQGAGPPAALRLSAAAARSAARRRLSSALSIAPPAPPWSPAPDPTASPRIRAPRARAAARWAASSLSRLARSIASSSGGGDGGRGRASPSRKPGSLRSGGGGGVWVGAGRQVPGPGGAAHPRHLSTPEAPEGRLESPWVFAIDAEFSVHIELVSAQLPRSVAPRALARHGDAVDKGSHGRDGRQVVDAIGRVDATHATPVPGVTHCYRPLPIRVIVKVDVRADLGAGAARDVTGGNRGSEA